MVLALFGDERVVTPGHAGAGLCLAVGHGQLCRHCLHGRELCPAAERHQHRARANGGIEPFGQSFFAAGVQIAHQRGQFFLKRALRRFAGFHAACRHAHVHMLLRAVGVQEFALDVADDIAVPAHDKARLRRHLGHDGGLQVFPVGCGNEFLRVLFRHHNGHALLALGDGKLGAVQPVIFFRYGVQVNGKAVGQLTDGDGNTARAEVVAALDHPRCFLCAEQALQLALHRRIALLHLCTAGLQALQLVGFGGPCRAAAAVAARAAAQQDHHVSGDGLLTAHVCLGHRAHHRADLHTLGDVARVVQLVHHTGGKADLVAVAGIARRGCRHQLALRQLAGHGIPDGHQWVARPGDAHGLVHIAAVGQRVPDGAADAGGRAAERLDLGGMIVRLVFEQQQPGLVRTVVVHGDAHAAGVDLVGFVHVLQHAGLFQVLSADGAQVHQAYGLVFARVHLPAQRKITLPCGLHRLVLDLHVV